MRKCAFRQCFQYSAETKRRIQSDAQGVAARMRELGKSYLSLLLTQLVVEPKDVGREDDIEAQPSLSERLDEALGMAPPPRTLDLQSRKLDEFTKEHLAALTFRAVPPSSASKHEAIHLS